jgi:hypothetical protein
LLACSSAKHTGETAAPGPGAGTRALTFRIDTDYQAAMDEEAVGVFYGAFWRGSEVTSLGPDDGAQDLGAIRVDPLDLRDGGGPTTVLFTSELLPAEEVVVLGFLDSDGNADPDDPGPDAKDPVTLPNDNDFDVLGGQTTTVEVFFGLLNPT